MILLIDNFDSFAHNLARYLRRLGVEVRVVRNNQITPAEVESLAPRAVVLSPGPCTPREAGCSLELVRRFQESLPILGVCLGHQTIAAAAGASIVRAPLPMHGRTSPIEHCGRGIFAGLPSPLEVCRYHSLVVEEATLPECLEITARGGDGTIMAIAHRTRPVVGVQFHPESILSAGGYPLLAGFLRQAGIEHRPVEGLLAAEQPLAASPKTLATPLRPVPW